MQNPQMLAIIFVVFFLGCFAGCSSAQKEHSCIGYPAHQDDPPVAPSVGTAKQQAEEAAIRRARLAKKATELVVAAERAKKQRLAQEKASQRKQAEAKKQPKVTQKAVPVPPPVPSSAVSKVAEILNQQQATVAQRLQEQPLVPAVVQPQQPEPAKPTEPPVPVVVTPQTQGLENLEGQPETTTSWLWWDTCGLMLLAAISWAIWGRSPKKPKPAPVVPPPAPIPAPAPKRAEKSPERVLEQKLQAALKAAREWVENTQPAPELLKKVQQAAQDLDVAAAVGGNSSKAAMAKEALAQAWLDYRFAVIAAAAKTEGLSPVVQGAVAIMLAQAEVKSAKALKKACELKLKQAKENQRAEAEAALEAAKQAHEEAKVLAENLLTGL